MDSKKFRCKDGYAMHGVDYLRHLDVCDECYASPLKRAEARANAEGWSYEVKVLRHAGEA